MGRFFAQIAASFIGILLFFLIMPFIVLPILIAAVMLPTASQPIGNSLVLTLDLRESRPDKITPSPLAEPSQAVDSVVGVVRALAQAEQDSRVKGLYVRFGSAGLPLAEAAEYREAFARFKASGKFIMAHTQSLFTQGLGDYYAVAGADEISMQPNGMMFSSGLSITPLFMRELLDNLGVTPEFRGYKEYKTAAHGFLYNDFTEPMRAARTRLVESMFDSVTGDIARDRDMTLEALKGLLADPPHIGQGAVDKGFFDAMRHAIDAKNAALARAGSGSQTIGIGQYAGSAGLGFGSSGTTVALIQAQGPIGEGSSDGPFSGDQIGGDTIAAAIMDAIKDKDVRAIILRVNSPGGSAIASEQIRDATARAQKANKPVVVSMAGLAASGGYWISMSSDKIIAHATTITGSIGVIGGKFVIKDLLDNIGVNGPTIATSEGVQLFSPMKTFSEEDWARFDRFMRATYDEFVQKVAAGRNLGSQEVEESAKGRVWTGSDALDRKLVDGIGGLRSAIDAVREVADMPESADVRLKVFPAPPTLEELLSELLGSSGGMGILAATLSRTMDEPAIRQMLRTMSMAREKGAITYEPLEAAR